MSVKIAIAGISEFLDLALLPIKSAFRQSIGAVSPPSTRKVAMMTPATDGVSVESSVCLGEPGACRDAAIELMRERRTLALEGFIIEEVAALCFEHNYRWRLDSGSTKQLRFIIEPGVKTPPPEDGSRKTPKASGGRD